MEEEDGGSENRMDIGGQYQRICVVGSLVHDSLVMSAVQKFSMPILLSDTGIEHLHNDSGGCIVFVVEDMEGPLSEAPHHSRYRVIGRTALLELAERGDSLPTTTRPLFCTSMSGLVVCFTGFRKKDHLMKLVRLVQCMGGSIRKEMSVSVTHLIAHSCGGKKYQYAITFRVPVVSEDWVFTAWERRKEVGFGASAVEFTFNFKLKPFQGAKICFVGFPEEERRHMEEVLVENGGSVADMTDCSHIVVESYKAYSLLKGKTAMVENKSQHSKCSDQPHPVPPQRRRSSFLHLLLSPNKCSAIREEDGSSSPRTPEPKSPSTSNYETPNLNLVPFKTPKTPYFPSISELPTSTPKDVVDHQDSSHDQMVTAEDWDCLSDPMDQTSPPGTPSGMSQTFEKPFPNYLYPDCVSQVADDPMMCDQEDTTAAPVIDTVQAQAANFPIPIGQSHIVKPEWFWISVQNEGAADESEYKFEGCLEGVVSLSGSFLDCSSVSEKVSTDEVEAAAMKSLSSLSPRQQVFHELVQTETNYVGIIRTIMTLIEKPLEEMAEGEEPLLDNTELKTIFGHLPPIYDLHAAMLQELIKANANWNENTSIGSIILRHSRDMVKAYPPFVNFFEQTKEMLSKCDKEKPRFHAFLKVCQSKPECGRQTLGELLIRPVQRLPSISLLLGDILKHTRKDNPDHAALDEALHAIREVMTHINEDKRRMEACMDMFSIFNDIDNCPPHLVSSHRAFVTRCDVIELSNELSGRGDALVFFLFSDILEVCKKRSRTTSLKSPNTATFKNTKHFKHVRLIPLSDIKRVFDVEREGSNEENIFALKCRSNQELKEKLYSFSLDEDVNKLNFLQTLCRQLANTVCKADAAYFLSQLDYSELDVSANDAAFGTLSKAFKLASRTKRKIGRTFSFNSRTPSKLKRAVSTMMSPFGSTTNLTPASQLAQMRLASCTNLNELASSPSSEPEALKPPMSVQPRRKRPV